MCVVDVGEGDGLELMEGRSGILEGSEIAWPNIPSPERTPSPVPSILDGDAGCLEETAKVIQGT